jgi:hypothetical protein
MLHSNDQLASFWGKVDRSSGPDACWPWLAAVDPAGYGALKVGRKKVNAHRFSLQLKLGRPIGTGLLACHTCHNRLCVNPAHLYEGTSSQNFADMLSTGQPNPTRFQPARPGHPAPKSGLTEEQALAIYRRANAGEDAQILALEFGVKPDAIHKIKRGDRWAWLTQPDRHPE